MELNETVRTSSGPFPPSQNAPSPFRSIALLALIAFPIFASAEPLSNDPTAEAAPAYNDIVARSFLIEVEPLVEKYTGWNSHWPIPFRLVTRAQYVEAMSTELEHQFSAQPNPTLRGMIKQRLQGQTVGLLGCYTAGSKSLFLLPGNLKPVLHFLGVEERYSRDVIELIMAHEMTHAVQDARYDLAAKVLSTADKDERTAWTMIVEGHASWVADRVAVDLHVEEAAQRLAEKLTASHPSPNLSGGQSAESARFRGYTMGKKFIEKVFARGGLKAVQAVFDHPPKSPAVIENPELFSPPQRARQ